MAPISLMTRPKPLFDPVSRLPQTHEEVIPEDYLDVMGHMNVMWYTHLFSMSMAGIFRLVGLSPEYMQEHHAGMFALESHIRYLSEVRAGHRVTVHSRFLDRSAKRMHLIHYLLNHDKQDVAASFEMVTTHIDMRVRRSSPFPEPIAATLDGLIAEHTRIDWAPALCGAIHS